MRAIAVAAVVLAATGCSFGDKSVAITASASACLVDEVSLKPGVHRLKIRNETEAPADVSLLHEPEGRLVAGRDGVPPGESVTVKATLDGGHYQVACWLAGTTEPTFANLFVSKGDGMPGIPPPDGDRVVEVSARDYRFGNLGQLATEAGQVYAGEMIVFRLTNRGPSAHAFAIKGPGGKRVAAIARTPAGDSRRVTFVPPLGGTYTYSCTVRGHAARGMKGSFTAAVSDADRG